MDKLSAQAILEAILFTMGEAVEIGRLAAVIEESNQTTREYITEMKTNYQKQGRGIDLIELEDSVQLCTKSDMYEYLVKIAKTPKKYVITDTQLETLSIIAYKQPVTKLEIENIRGVSSDFSVNKLVEYGLVQELGRKDAPGRPMLFGTTEQFLRSFGVKSLEELPEINPMQIEEFKEEAEAEAKQVVDI